MDMDWSGSTLYLDFNDTSRTGVQGVYNASVRVYYASNDTLIDTYYPPVNPWIFNYSNADLNTSINYNVCLSVKYAGEEESWNETRCYFVFAREEPFIDDVGFLDDVFGQIFGTSPVSVGGQVVAYSSLIAAFLSLIVFFSFSSQYAGFGVVAVGFVLAVFKNPLGLLQDSVINFVAVSVIVIIGILMILREKKRS